MRHPNYFLEEIICSTQLKNIKTPLIIIENKYQPRKTNRASWIKRKNHHLDKIFAILKIKRISP